MYTFVRIMTYVYQQRAHVPLNIIYNVIDGREQVFHPSSTSQLFLGWGKGVEWRALTFLGVKNILGFLFLFIYLHMLILFNTTIILGSRIKSE